MDQASLGPFEYVFRRGGRYEDNQEQSGGYDLPHYCNRWWLVYFYTNIISIGYMLNLFSCWCIKLFIIYIYLLSLNYFYWYLDY